MGNKSRRVPNRGAYKQVAGREPTPEFALEMADTLWHLLERLNDETLRQIVHWKLAHLSNRQIAVQLGRSDRSSGSWNGSASCVRSS